MILTLVRLHKEPRFILENYFNQELNNANSTPKQDEANVNSTRQSRRLCAITKDCLKVSHG